MKNDSNNHPENPKKITWVNIVNAIIQALIAALTALGVTSCVPFITDLL